ncbi:MAG TPA: alpha/beta fold hydrolase, partial [Acidimicrobiales bacterium]|nr:alpha/beta fold hydrolase [Acidimicrobiales bacterium]
MPTIDRDGLQLYFADTGRGTPVLFHTGGGGDHRMWEMAGYPRDLGGRRHLLLDHRGHGQSSSPTEVEAHRIERYISDVVAVLDQAGVERAVLIGYSDGANVLLRVASAHPDRCEAVVAIGGPPEPIDLSEMNRSLATYLRTVGMRGLIEQMSAEEPEPAPLWL